MNRAVLQSSPVEQMMGGRTTTRWWNLSSSNMRQTSSSSPQQNSPLCSSPPNLSSSSPSSLSDLPQYYPFPSGTGTLPSIPWHDTQDLPESWSQLLLGGLVEEDGRSSLITPFQTKKEENDWEDLVLFQTPANAQMVDVIKKERSADSSTGSYAYGIGNPDEIQPHASACRSDPWNQILPLSSPRSCITSFSSNNMLDFSNNKADGRHPKPAGCSSECNGTASGSAVKKAKIQASTAQSSFKVRKEKLGDRITALHQLVSPFGKTDTASVLLEAIGYIRFLQSQIEALSSPYLDTTDTISGSNSRNSLLNEACMKKRRGACDHKEGETDEQKDLKSRGLCLVPISCTTHVGSDNGADYWASAFGAAFR